MTDAPSPGSEGREQRSACHPRSRTCSSNKRRLACLVAAALGTGAGGCGHRAPPPSAVPKPIAVAALPQVNPEARAEFQAALRLLKQGSQQHAEARAHLQRATELDPRFFEAWHDLGWLDASRGNFAHAAAAFQHALDIQPGSRETALALGETWRRAGYPKKAAKLYGDRLAGDPTDAELRNRYIQVLRDAGDLDEAMSETKLALGQAGENVGETVFAYNSLGLIYYKMQKLDLAEAALRKAVELDGKSAFVWNNLGLVAFARGRDQEAFLDFQKASELDPKYVEARLNKAIIYMDCGDYKHALAELQRATEASPGDADAFVALGVAARGSSKLDEARRAYERALEIEPEHAQALFDLGVLYMEFDKDPVKARRSFAAFLEAADENEPHRKDAAERLADLDAAGKLVGAKGHDAATERPQPKTCSPTPARRGDGDRSPRRVPHEVVGPGTRSHIGGAGRQQSRRRTTDHRRHHRWRLPEGREDEGLHLRGDGRGGQAQDAAAPVLPQPRQAGARHVGAGSPVLHEGAGDNCR